MRLSALMRDLREAKDFLGDVEVNFRPATNFVATVPIAKAKMVGQTVVLCEDANS